MSKIRTGIWILILIFLILLFFQNEQGFLTARSFQLNLYFVKYKTPELPDGLFFLLVFVIGLLISYLFNLGDRFKAKRALKNLSVTLDARQQEVTQLKKELEEVKRVSPPEPAPRRRSERHRARWQQFQSPAGFDHTSCGSECRPASDPENLSASS